FSFGRNRRDCDQPPRGLRRAVLSDHPRSVGPKDCAEKVPAVFLHSIRSYSNLRFSLVLLVSTNADSWRVRSQWHRAARQNARSGTELTLAPPAESSQRSFRRLAELPLAPHLRLAPSRDRLHPDRYPGPKGLTLPSWWKSPDERSGADIDPSSVLPGWRSRVHSRPKRFAPNRCRTHRR